MAADAKVTFTADGSAFTRALAKMAKDLAAGTSSMTARVARLGQALQGLSTMWNAGSSVMNFLTAPAAAAEELQVAFATFLGSEEKALDFMAQLTEYAAKTSFAMNEISVGAKILLANTNLGASEVVETLKRLGEFAVASKKPLGEIAALYAKATSVGVNNEVMESFANMGIPLKKTIAELRGVSEKEVFNMASRRELGVEHLNAAIDSLTGPGGKFHGLVEKTGQTFNGLVSTLGDGLEIMVQKFTEGLMPHIKKVLDALIEAADKLTPIFQVLGKQIGDTLGVKAGEGLVTLIRSLIMEVPKLGVQMQYAFQKVAAIIEKLMPLIEKFTDNDAPLWMRQEASNRAREALLNSDEFESREEGEDYLKYDFRWRYRWWKREKEELAKIKKEEATKLETWRDAELEKIEQQNAAMLAQAKQIEDNRRAEAQAADEAAAAAAAAAAEDKKRRDAEGRAIMLAAEEATRAENERQKLIEENEKRLKNYRERRRNWERKQAEEAYGKRSIARQQRELREEGKSLGVAGEVSPESIRARLDELAAAGAKSNEREIAALERLLEKWAELTKRKEEYAKTRSRDMMELRAGAMEAAGNRRGANALREQMALTARIEELKNKGASARQAREQALAEQNLRQANAISERIRQRGVEFIQSSEAAMGNGGVSIRIGGATLEESKRQTKLLQDVYRFLRENRRSSNTTVAVLG